MRPVYIKLSAYAVCLFCFFSFGSLAVLADSANSSCPDQNTLTNPARTALFNAQEQLNQKKVGVAKKILEEFLTTHAGDNHPYISFTLGSVYLELNSMSKAKASFEDCVKQCPGFVAGWQNLGKVCYDLKNYNRAAQAFESIYKLNNKPLYRFHAAVAWMEAKHNTRAFEHVLFLTNGNAGVPKKEWVKLLVHLSLNLKRTKEAVNILESLLAKQNPQDYLFKMAASLYLEQNSYRKAAQALKAYSMIKDLNCSEMKLMADLLYSQEVPLKAANWYEKVYKRKPNLNNCVRLVASLHEGFAHQKAIMAADKGIHSYPGSSELWRLKAWACYGDKNFHDAVHCFLKAANLNKKDTKSLFMGGFAAYRAGEKNKARNLLKLAAECKEYKSQANALIRQIDYEISQKS